MITRPELFKQLVEQREGPVEQQVDVDKLEILICLESLLVVCYQTLEGLAHNQAIRKEYQQFEMNVQYHQEELIRIFLLSPKSKVAIESKVYKYLLQFKTPSLSLRAVINLASHLTVFKIEIYKYLSCTVKEHHELLNSFFEDSVEEISFLHQENKFHKNRLDAYLKV